MDLLDKDKARIKKQARKWFQQDNNISRLVNKGKVKALLKAVDMNILEEDFYEALSIYVYRMVVKSALRSIDNHRTAIKASDL